MKRTKLISILTCLTALTSSIVVVSCTNDNKTTILHNKQTDIKNLELNTNLYELTDNNPETIIKTFLDLNDNQLTNLNKDQLEVKMIDSSNAVINIKNSNQFVGTTKVKFEVEKTNVNKNKSDSINLKESISDINSTNKSNPSLITPISKKERDEKKENTNEFVKLNSYEQETYNDISINSNASLDEINNKYIDQTLKAFNQIKLSENKAKEMMLNNQVASNFYSHPRFELDKDEIILDKHQNKEIKLQLIDKNTLQPISRNQIKWYQRISYPTDAVITSKDSQDNATFILTDDGTLKWKDTKESDGRSPDEKSARLWAEYKGYLYSAVIRVYSDEISELLNNEDLAKQAARQLVIEKNWNALPPLEKLTKAYEWVTKEIKYDYDRTLKNSLKNQNAHSALVEKYTVCTGYAKGLKLILEEMGIPCRFVEGDSGRESSGVRHAWNLVQIDDKWYHVDTTSDRVEKDQDHTKFNFFLNTNDDFSKKDNFNRDFDNKGTRLRNLKFKNFVVSEDDAIALIDNAWDPETKQLNKLDVITNERNFITVNKAFKKRNLDSYIKSSKFTLVIGPNKQASYTFSHQTNETINDIKVIKVEQYKDKHAIRIEFDQKVDDLKIGNFNISNALINKIEQQDKSYILYLDHFSSYDNVEVKLESIKKKDYKFIINTNNKVEFNIQKHKRPEAQIQLLDSGSVKITNHLDNLEYNFNNTSWKDVPKDFIIPDAILGKLNIRYKASDNKLSSDTQTIILTRSQIPTNHNIKVFNKTLTGVDDKMQYRLKNQNSTWINITNNKIQKLEAGTYEIRVKPNKTALASEIVEITIN
ncbi:MAG6410 family transglutaminase-related lipoprotein [Mycoplasma capricolum]|uniref:MAG6410 family transglutaminase-related lipoprotein n=1 Tax=Mycoplasma capricolum TaxID=2095 RepID=UPI0034DB029D